MLTQISPVFTLARSSDMIARPTCAPTLRTPGTVRSSAAARATIRFISGCPTPGAPSQWIRTSRWRNVGSGPSDPAGVMASPRTMAAPTSTVASMTTAGRILPTNQPIAEA